MESGRANPCEILLLLISCCSRPGGALAASPVPLLVPGEGCQPRAVHSFSQPPAPPLYIPFVVLYTKQTLRGGACDRPRRAPGHPSSSSSSSSSPWRLFCSKGRRLGAGLRGGAGRPRAARAHPGPRHRAARDGYAARRCRPSPPCPGAARSRSARLRPALSLSTIQAVHFRPYRRLTFDQGLTFVRRAPTTDPCKA